MAKGKEIKWGAILAGAAVVTGVVAACIWMGNAQGMARTVGNFISDQLTSIVSAVANFAKTGGGMGAATVLGAAAVAGGWVGKRVADISDSAKGLADDIRGR